MAAEKSLGSTIAWVFAGILLIPGFWCLVSMFWQIALTQRCLDQSAAGLSNPDCTPAALLEQTNAVTLMSIAALFAVVVCIDGARNRLRNWGLFAGTVLVVTYGFASVIVMPTVCALVLGAVGVMWWRSRVQQLRSRDSES